MYFQKVMTEASELEQLILSDQMDSNPFQKHRTYAIASYECLHAKATHTLMILADISLKMVKE